MAKLAWVLMIMAEFVDIDTDQGMVHPEYFQASEPVRKTSKRTIDLESPMDNIVDTIFHDAFLTYCTNKTQPSWVTKKLEALTESQIQNDGKATLGIYHR